VATSVAPGLFQSNPTKYGIPQTNTLHLKLA